VRRAQIDTLVDVAIGIYAPLPSASLSIVVIACASPSAVAHELKRPCCARSTALARAAKSHRLVLAGDARYRRDSPETRYAC